MLERILIGIISAVGNFLGAVWTTILRLLSPLDPRPGYSAVGNYFKAQFAPVTTLVKESGFVIDLFTKSLGQTFKDIGTGFGSLAAILRLLRS